MEWLSSWNVVTKVLVTLATVVSTIMGGWLFLASTFVEAEDFKQYLAMDATQAAEQRITSEQAVNDLRLDVLEDRLEREYRNLSDDPYKETQLLRQIDGLEKRQETLQQQLDQLR